MLSIFLNAKLNILIKIFKIINILYKLDTELIRSNENLRFEIAH